MEQTRHGIGQTRWTRSSWLLLAGILGIGLLLRLAILRTTEPLIWGDSEGYLYLAQGLLNRQLSLDAGTRTPTYPLFLVFSGNDTQRAVVFQAMIGLAITAMVFWVAWAITKSNIVAAIAAIIYAIDVSQIQFEISILTETLTAFLLLLSIALLMIAWNKDNGKEPYGIYLAAGVASGLTVLTRPAYIYLPLVLFLAAIVRAVILKRKLSPGFIILIPPAVIVLGWATFNYMRINYFGLSTLIGFTLIDMVGPYMELAPNKYSQIRDILLAYRPAQVAVQGWPRGIQWVSVDEVARATGLSAVELSKIYTRMSLYLIFHHLDLYAKAVWPSWLLLWSPSLLREWPINVPTAAPLYQWLKLAWKAEAAGYLAINTLFLLLSYGTFVWMAWLQPRQLTGWLMKDHHLMLVTMGSIAILSAISHAFLTFGEARFGLPARPLIAIVTLSVALLAYRQRYVAQRSA